MTENRYKTILGEPGLAYLKNDQPVDVETRNVRSEKTKGVDDPIEQATKLMEMCRCQYLDDANDLWTCHKPPEDTSNFFSVCRGCQERPWSLHDYAKGMFMEWTKHMKFFGTFRSENCSLKTIEEATTSDNEWLILSSYPKVHMVYAFRQEERYTSLRGSTQATPFVRVFP